MIVNNEILNGSDQFSLRLTDSYLKFLGNGLTRTSNECLYDKKTILTKEYNLSDQTLKLILVQSANGSITLDLLEFLKTHGAYRGITF